MSSTTRIWPSQAGEPPIPIVGTATAAVSLRARLSETPSTNSGNAPGHLVAQTSRGFRFKHALLCDIAHKTLLTPRRQKLRQRIAEALEAMPGNFAERESGGLAAIGLPPASGGGAKA